MKIIEITYDEDIGEAQASFTKEFIAMPRIIQLDCLADAKAEIQSLYQIMLQKEEIV
jgi:hypothetical protein